MVAVYGATGFQNGESAFGNVLLLVDGPLNMGWHHCSTTSEFLGEFYALASAAFDLDSNEVRHSVGYLVNELHENAVKFRAAGDISIESSMLDARFEINISNVIAEAASDKFQALLSEIMTRDPGEVLIERIEANAENPDSHESGLGLLTLMSDYGVKLGWTFRKTAPGEPVQLTTWAALQFT